MKDLKGKVAVVTGAASGIGRALAERFVVEGMKVVLADVEEDALKKAVSELDDAGADVLAVRTDVSKLADVEALARVTLDAFGAVHVVCNNAGVAGPIGPLWTQRPEDWQWVLGVNLWGVIHGIRVFVPILLAQGDEGHVVNTASIAGLLAIPNTGPYTASKHAVVAVSETLHHELALVGAKIRVSVLCPGFVRTAIADSHRNRPDAPAPAGAGPGDDAWVEGFRRAIDAGIPPEICAHRVIEAMAEERLYVLTHADLAKGVHARWKDALGGGNPAFRPFL